MGGAPYGGDSLAGQTADEPAIDGIDVPYLFQVRNMFFSWVGYWWSLLVFGLVPFGSAVRRGSKTLWSFGLPKKQYRHCLGNFDLSPNYRGSGTGVNIIASRRTLFDRPLTDPKRQNKKCQNEYCYIWNEISSHGESSVRAGNSQRQSHEGPPQLAASFIFRSC